MYRRGLISRSVDLEELNLELERGVGRDDRRVAISAVCLNSHVSSSDRELGISSLTKSGLAVKMAFSPRES
jgi:hypothetical protein